MTMVCLMDCFYAENTDANKQCCIFKPRPFVVGFVVDGNQHPILDLLKMRERNNTTINIIIREREIKVLLYQ